MTARTERHPAAHTTALPGEIPANPTRTLSPGAHIAETSRTRTTRTTVIAGPASIAASAGPARMADAAKGARA
jgi:hypothetical protein